MPPKEKVLARIPGKGSVPSVEVLAKPRSFEESMPSFGTRHPLVEPIESRAKTRIDSISPCLSVKGVGRNAHKLFRIMRLLREGEEVPFRADSSGIFWGEKKVGQVIDSSGERPLIRIWMDWVYSSAGKRAKNHNLLDKLPLPALLQLFEVKNFSEFVRPFFSTNYAAISADITGVRLGLYEKKKDPELHTFHATLI